MRVPVYQRSVVVGYAHVDAVDYERVAHRRWQRWTSTTGIHYARCNVWDRTGKCRTLLMHVEIIGKLEGLVIDHKDRDGLNNRRSNLRHVTHAENCRNRDRSKYPGVRPWRGRWRTDININGKRTRKLFNNRADALAYVEGLLTTQ